MQQLVRRGAGRTLRAGALGCEHHDERRDLLGRREAAGREAADAGDDPLARRVGVDAGGGRHGLGHAALAEPEVRRDRTRRCRRR
jgi:hypothetical protein